MPLIRCVAAVLLASLASVALAQDGPPPKATIYRCDVNGRTITSDKPLAECSAREQRVLNSDGSTKTIVPPTLTAEERAEREARQREADAERARLNDAIRRDRNLIQRFPDEARHQAARLKALDDVRASVRNSEQRVSLLKTERKPLEEEAEFYVGKQLPLKLKLALDANDASMEAQKSLVANQQVEIGRINSLYDAELARLRKLWGGAPLGSLGPAGTGAAVSTAGATASTPGVGRTVPR